MRHPPDHIGEQQLGDQHGQNAGKSDAQIGVAEDRGAEPDEPRDHRRMIEERKHVLLRPGPVIGFVGAQIYHACVDHPQCRHRDDQHHSGRQLPKDGSFRFRVDTVGRGNRHDAFSPTPDGVSTSWAERSCRDQGYQCCSREIDIFSASSRRAPGPIATSLACVRRYRPQYQNEIARRMGPGVRRNDRERWSLAE